jgi:uncharacterized phiE125 gp8 family phage protein
VEGDGVSLTYATREAWKYVPAVTVQTAPSGSVLSAATIRAHVAQPLPDDDEMLETIGLVAQEWVEAYLGRALLSQTREASYDGDPGRVVLLPEPVTSVTSVTTYDDDAAATAVTTTTYALDTATTPARLLLRDGQLWPSSLREHASLVVRYVAGWTAITMPYAVRQALLLMVAHLYEHRDTAAVPAGIESLLMPYRVRTGLA